MSFPKDAFAKGLSRMLIVEASSLQDELERARQCGPSFSPCNGSGRQECAGPSAPPLCLLRLSRMEKEVG